METSTKPSDIASLDSNLLPIPPEYIDQYWQQVVPHLQSGVDSMNGRMNLQDLYGYLKESDLILWVSVKDGKIEACAVTEIINHPKKKMCAVRIMSGRNYRNWVSLEQGIASWAASIGCDGMEAIARKGWQRIYKDYDASHIFLEKMF